MQILSVLFPLLISPFLYGIYGAKVFGGYSVIFTWSALLALSISLKIESSYLFKTNEGLDRSKINYIAYGLVGVSSLLVLSLYFLMIWIWSIDFNPVYFIAIFVAIALAVFNIVNAQLVINGGYGYYYLQIIKSAVFSLLALSLFYVAPNLGLVIGLFFSYLIPVLVARHMDPNLFVVSRSGVVYTASLIKRSFGFFTSSILNAGRDSLIIAFVAFKFGVIYSGWYFLFIMYMVKPFVAYNTVVGNYYRRKLSVDGYHSKDIIRLMLLGLFVFFVFTLFLLFVPVLASFFDIKLFEGYKYAWLFLPLTLSYLVFDPFLTLMNFFVKGLAEAFINICHVLAIAVLLVYAAFNDVDFADFIFIVSCFYFLFSSIRASIFLMLRGNE